MHRNESKKEALGIKREKKGIEGDHLVKNWIKNHLGVI
jgi:hypothetical protein